MKSQETDIRDHQTDNDAFRAEVHRHRQAVSKRQAMFASLIFGADDVDEHEPEKTEPRSGWSVNSVLGTNPSEQR
jgi:hypothetical protein